MATKLDCECEWCKKTKLCTFYGKVGDVNTLQAQIGSWICDDCYPAFLNDLDTAIEKLEAALDDFEGDDNGSEEA